MPGDPVCGPQDLERIVAVIDIAALVLSDRGERPNLAKLTAECRDLDPALAVDDVAIVLRSGALRSAQKVFATQQARR